MDALLRVTTLSDQGRYKEALKIALASLADCRREHPEDARAIAEWLNLAGFVCLRLGEYASAADFLEEGLHLVRGSNAGGARLLYANCATNLAAVRSATGRFLEAKALHEEALAIRRELSVDPGRDPMVAQSMSNIAIALHALGGYSAAMDLHRQALSIDRASLGRSHLSVAQDLNNIGCVHMDVGAYPEAASCHRGALNIRRKRLPANHPDIAESLSNLASLALTTLNFDEAERLYREVLEIKAAAFGEDSPQSVRTLHNLATGLRVRSQSRDSNQEASVREAIALESRALGIVIRQASVGHPDAAAVLRGLAYRFSGLGDHEKAETLFTAALKITRERLGPSHPETAECLGGRGRAYMRQGKLALAEHDLLEAREMMVRSLGEDHPDVAAVLTDLGQVCVAVGRDEEALEYFRQAMTIDTATIGRVFTIASEGQRAAYVDGLRWKYDLFLSFATTRGLALPGSVPAAFELVLRRKGIEAEMLGALRGTIMCGRHPEAEADLRQLFQIQAQIARRLLDGPGGTDLAEHHRMLWAWRVEQEELEIELTLKVPELSLSRISGNVAITDVARLQPAMSALIEIARVGGHKHAWLAESATEARYVAFILLGEHPERLELVELGPADQIDEAILAAFPFSGTEPAEPQTARKQLRKLIFDPLLPHLGERSRLLISPDGAIQFVPFGLLETDEGTYLIDDFQIDYLSSGRDLLGFTADPYGCTGPVIIADPDFNLSATPGSGRASGPFGRSPGFGVEGKWLRRKLLCEETWLGPDALKGKVRRVESPQILHFATHGFVDEPAGMITYTRLAAHGTERDTNAPYPHLNPLLFSGLALAGANTWKEGGEPAEDAEDGVLTAEDVTSMNLLGTELVTLAACDTGRGGLRTGEGVLGLRRSFTIAGARVLIMSLFQVPGWMAFELTRELYTRVLEEPVSYAAALRAAQLSLKERYPGNPEWGYFICQGDAELRWAQNLVK
jgi:tetratricopeptide (TPR) repeat protein/CHAT domain-containing protein